MTPLPDLSLSYRSEVQGLRAVAIILVVLYHTGVLFNSGFIGVDVFFVISGYVIAASLRRELKPYEQASLQHFQVLTCFYIDFVLMDISLSQRRQMHSCTHGLFL